MPPDSTPEATSDVDMISLPPTASYDVANSEVNQSPRSDEAVQEEDADDIPDDASTAAQADGNEEDIPDLVGLDMDRSSVDEVHTGSDAEENTMVADISEEGTAQELDKYVVSEQEIGPNSDLGDNKPSGLVDSSATTSDGGVDSDSKTLETVATSTSTDAPAKDCRSQSPSLRILPQH